MGEPLSSEPSVGKPLSTQTSQAPLDHSSQHLHGEEGDSSDQGLVKTLDQGKLPVDGKKEDRNNRTHTQFENKVCMVVGVEWRLAAAG